MEFAPAGVSLSFEVTYDRNDLNVGMSVYDDSGVTPLLIAGPTAMLNVVGNTYRAKFTANPGRSYIIFKAVYTDDTLTVLSEAYSQASESVKAEFLVGSDVANNCEVLGLVESNNEVIGLVETTEILGLIEC